MIDEERIILMSRLASYEDNEGKKNIKIGKYFRSDYITIQMLKAFFGGTISFLLCFALYIFCDFEVFMQDLYKIDLVRFAQNALMYYLVFIAIYGVVCYFLAMYRYISARKSLKGYYQSLKKLGKMYSKKQ